MKNLEKHLLMGGLTIAHELVHFFAGRIIGVPETDTPDKINAPPGLMRAKGESGRFWEDKFVGCNIEAFYDPADPLKDKQAGILWADKKTTPVAPADQKLVDHAWVKKMLTGTFTPATLAAPKAKRKQSDREMRETRRPADGNYIDGNKEFATYYDKIKSKPTLTLSGAELARVKGIASEACQYQGGVIHRGSVLYQSPTTGWKVGIVIVLIYRYRGVFGYQSSIRLKDRFALTCTATLPKPIRGAYILSMGERCARLSSITLAL
ncbi:hypothetical protein QBC40DRAFT_168889 [Triangularia verruculosa]|uniref:Uncharacterized protein n=1 Tax=Triangularia verruculosa TaxID=2587418 RepID=A0AAN6XNT8_9PEZI|nr:hypothetical protein QBC40DRAFT_168889 [Triangularia verruculosa]